MGNSTLIRFTFLLVAALILTGCVSYYPYPERIYSASDNSVQYYDQGSDQEYDQSYDQSYDSSVAYSSTYYYPWWSMDYFYLGNHYYRPSLAFSFSYGRPWYSPYYGYYGYSRYYSPWYPAYYGNPYAYYGSGWSWGIGLGYGYGYGYGWSDPYWYHRYRGYDHYRYGDHHYKRGYDRGYAGYGRGHDDYGRGNEGYGHRYPQDGYRRVSVAPSGPGSDRSMVVVNRSDGKPRQSRIQPIVSQERYGQAVVRTPQPSRDTRTVQQDQMRVAQPGNNKQGPSRTGMPVEARRAPGGPEVVMNQPPRSNQTVVRMPPPSRPGDAGNGSPPRVDYQSGGREPQGGSSRESHGDRGGRGDRGHRDRD